MSNTQIIEDKRVKKKAFLAAFVICGVLSKSADIAQINRLTHTNWVKADPDYATAFERAKIEHIELLETELNKRALAGKEDHQSHLLLMFRLKRLIPEYRENADLNLNLDINVDSIKNTLQMLVTHGFKSPNDLLSPGGLAIEGEIVGKQATNK